MSSILDVAMVTDRAYLPWCATAISSCSEHCGSALLRFHLFHPGDLTGNDLRLLEVVANSDIRFTQVDEERLQHLPSKGQALGGRTSWIRILLPELLDTLGRVLYLDADVMVLDSLDSVLALDLGGALLAGVRNVVEPSMRLHVTDLGLDPFAYFNAGVLLMDLEAMRTRGLTAALNRMAADLGSRLSWYDQDALNLACKDEWLPIHPRWNTQNSFWLWREWAEETHGIIPIEEATASPGILHFEGPAVCKPWHFLSIHPYRTQYISQLRLTPWRDEPLIGASLTNRLLKALPTNLRLPAYAIWASTRTRFEKSLRSAGRRISHRFRSTRHQG